MVICPWCGVRLRGDDVPDRPADYCSHDVAELWSTEERSMNNHRCELTTEERQQLRFALDDRMVAIRRMIESCDDADAWRDADERSAYVRNLAHCEKARAKLRS